MNITSAQIHSIVHPKGKNSVIDAFVSNFNKHAEEYGINTPLRLAHIIAQFSVESDGFNTLKEYASGREYEGRKDLGNTHTGDGVRYAGRGAIQITGRANYKKYGDMIGVDLENHPEKALDPEIAVLVSLAYWKDHKLSDYADHDDILTITKRINGGTNGLVDRKHYLALAKKTFGNDIP
jgi:predicted chitinase